MRQNLTAVVAFTFVVAACSEEVCNPGTVESCACPGGSTGQRLCDTEGTPGSCACAGDAGPASDAATNDDAGAPRDGGPGDTGAAAPDGGGPPGDPPQLEIACLRAGDNCNATAGMLGPCVALSFGTISPLTGDHCDLLVELRNHARVGATRPGDLVIDRLDVAVTDLGTLQPVPPGMAGFTMLDDAGDPLVVTAATPLRIPVPVGAAVGARQIRVRFDGSYPGPVFGQRSTGDGFTVSSNDPDMPTAYVTVTGQGAAPAITVAPSRVEFGEDPAPAIRTLQIVNTGDAPLLLNAMHFVGTGPFTVTPPSPLPLTIPALGRVTVAVGLSASGSVTDALSIDSSDLRTPTLHVPVSAGLVPRILVTPPDTVVLGGQGSAQPVTIANAGLGDLVIDTLTITGPNADLNHPSADDFTIDGCTTNPCTLATTLCGTATPGCTMSSTTVLVRYANNDLTATDLAELHIRSSDSATPEQVLVLSGSTE